MSEWAKCDNVVKTPKRSTVKIPKFIQDEYPFLAKSFKVRDRAVKELAPIPSFKPKVKKDEVDGDVLLCVSTKISLLKCLNSHSFICLRIIPIKATS